MGENGLTEREISDIILEVFRLSGSTARPGYHEFNTEYMVPAYTFSFKNPEKEASKINFLNSGDSPYYSKAVICTKDMSEIKNSYPMIFRKVIDKYGEGIEVKENNGTVICKKTVILDADSKANEQKLRCALDNTIYFVNLMAEAYNKKSKADDEIIASADFKMGFRRQSKAL
ncbi:Uncharacterised protein [uncultured archaeon]|nr:Uncharacterised protein [uncultured archaeon]